MSDRLCSLLWITAAGVHMTQLKHFQYYNPCNCHNMLCRRWRMTLAGVKLGSDRVSNLSCVSALTAPPLRNVKGQKGVSSLYKSVCICV